MYSLPFKFFLSLLILLAIPNCSKEIPIVKPNSASSCQKVVVPSGPEDMELVESSGNNYLLVSSHERRIPDREGYLSYIKLDKSSLTSGKFTALPLKVDRMPDRFRPHGISHSTHKGKNRLYVISHPTNNSSNPPIKDTPKHTIEVWEEIGKGSFEWKFIKTLTDDKLESPNDLFALPEERLLISNDMGTEINFMSVINILFKRSTTDITYYAEGKFYSVNQKIPFGNGIWYEEENGNRFLFRSSHVDKSVYVYDADWVENHSPILKLRFKIPFPGGPDNLYKNKYGFFTTTHNDDFKFLDHVKSAENISPTQVWKISDNKQTNLIYSNPGEEISAGSTAIQWENWLFISQVFEGFILACPVKVDR